MIMQNFFPTHTSMSLFTVDLQTILEICYTVGNTKLSIVHEDRIDNVSIMCLVLKLKSALLNYHQKYTFTNPNFILDVHVSSFLGVQVKKKGSHF